MGIYDREYYRREGPSFLGAIAEQGKICKWLIGVNVAFFLIQLMTGGEEGPFTHALELDPARVMNGEVWRLLTYAFLHSTSIWHILFNMLFLWWFGHEMEERYGQREFLAFYLVSAVVGGLIFQLAAVTGWASPVELRGLDEFGNVVRKVIMPSCIGASGAVTAVMVLYALHFPTRIIYISFFFPVPIWLFVLFEVGQDAFIFASHQNTTTAVAVHLGGAVFGFVYYKMHWRLLSLWPGLRTWQRTRSRPKLQVYREEEPSHPVPVTAPPGPDVDEQLEAKLDAVLEKVARFGQSSLTDTELQILLRASEAYKKRRP